MSITHPAGVARTANTAILITNVGFSLTALAIFAGLAVYSSGRHDVTQNLIYGLSLLACSLCSFCYAIFREASFQRIIRHLDHSAIFLLIAGTYTPFAVFSPEKLWGVNILYGVWGFALLGIALRLTIRHGYDRLFIGLYVLFGWLILATLPGVAHHIAMPSLALLVAGAAVYTIGAIIFAYDVGRWTDALWHGCVLTAGCLHFFAVFVLSSGMQSQT